MGAAAFSSTPEIVALLIEKGAEVNAKAPMAGPRCAAAAFSSTPEIVALLIEKGAEVNAKSTSGWTPLMVAAGDSSTP